MAVILFWFFLSVFLNEFALARAYML
jgi:hypothetical protein